AFEALESLLHALRRDDALLDEPGGDVDAAAIRVRHDDAVLEPDLAHELGRLDVQDAGLAIGDEVLHHVAKRHRGDLSLEAHVLSANTLAEDYDGDRERSNHRTAISERMGTRPRQAGVTAPADDE